MYTEHRIVLLADTHVGDRVKALDPALLAAIKADQPEAILHAGDVVRPQVLEELARIAPVHAVMGNRDWLRRQRLPMAIYTEINGVRFTLSHGHINMFHYLYNYLYLFLTGNKRTHLYYQKALARLYPQADVIIYGHTYFAVDEMMDGQRFINPGTGLPQARNHFTLQYSLMLVAPDGTLQVLPRQITPSQP